MPVTFTNFSPGDVVSASDIQEKFEAVGDFINEEIESSDLTSASNWIGRNYIFKPEFYGAPSPRMLGVTGDVYHRYTSDGYGHQVFFHANHTKSGHPCPGLGVTFKVPKDNCVVSVFCNLYIYEEGGDLPERIAYNTDTTLPLPRMHLWDHDTGESAFEDNGTQCARLYLAFNDGPQVAGTVREICLASDVDNRFVDYGEAPVDGTKPGIRTFANYFARKNVSMICHQTLNQGAHSVAVYVRPLTTTNGQNTGQIIVDVRSMVVDVHLNYSE